MSPAATIATTCLIALGTCSCTPADPPPLNVVLIVIDDLGWMDSGTYGSTFYETPNIDRLASEGVRFTDFYTASSVCSPTRASVWNRDGSLCPTGMVITMQYPQFGSSPMMP